MWLQYSSLVPVANSICKILSRGKWTAFNVIGIMRFDEVRVVCKTAILFKCKTAQNLILDTKFSTLQIWLFLKQVSTLDKYKDYFKVWASSIVKFLEPEEVLAVLAFVRAWNFPDLQSSLVFFWLTEAGETANTENTWACA